MKGILKELIREDTKHGLSLNTDNIISIYIDLKIISYN